MRRAKVKKIASRNNVKYTRKTEQQNDSLRKLYVESGMSIAALARVYNISRSAMLSRLKQVGAWNKTKNPVNASDIINLCLAGRTINEIVEITGTSKVSIHTVLKEANLKCKRPIVKKQSFEVPVETLFDLYITQNKTTQQVADALGTSRTAITKRLSEAEIRKFKKG